MKENIDSTFLPGATTVVDSIELLNEFEELALDKDLIAFDAEGVDLSRVGELTLLSFGISLFNGVHVFLLDPLCREIGDKTLEVSKRILESKNITKIIHDCRQDSDALYHTFTPSIKLTNVFDTQIWDMNCNHGLRRGLNDVLASHGLQVNQSRNGCVAMYLSNPNFWKQRYFFNLFILGKCSIQLFNGMINSLNYFRIIDQFFIGYSNSNSFSFRPFTNECE